MKRPIPPCKGCEFREVGCHADCEPYQAFRKAKDEFNAELKRIAMLEQVQNDIERDRIRRVALGTFRVRRKE